MPTISGPKQKNVSPLPTPYTMLLYIGLKTDLTAWFSGFTLHNIERGKGGGGGGLGLGLVVHFSRVFIFA